MGRLVIERLCFRIGPLYAGGQDVFLAILQFLGFDTVLDILWAATLLLIEVAPKDDIVTRTFIVALGIGVKRRREDDVY